MHAARQGTQPSTATLQVHGRHEVLTSASEPSATDACFHRLQSCLALHHRAKAVKGHEVPLCCVQHNADSTATDTV